jgi:hypothetical protein
MAAFFFAQNQKEVIRRDGLLAIVWSRTYEMSLWA